MKRKNKYPPDSGQPLVAHLIELRNRLIRVLIGMGVAFLAMFPFANELYVMLAQPLLAHLPEGSSMIATEVASPFLAPFKFTLVAAFFAIIPLVLYQVWSFIAPGLYKTERRLVLPLLFASSLLFYAGMIFAYFVVFPLVFRFLIGVAPEGVEVMTDISKYLEFVLKLLFAFGMAFEVPIATIVLVWSGATTPQSLRAKRPYVIVAAFVIGMLLTPPDLISQTLLAVPMWLLFEMGVIFSRFFVRDSEESMDAADAPESEPEPEPEDKNSS